MNRGRIMRWVKLFNRIGEEHEDFKREMLSLPQEKMYDHAERIHVYEIAREIIEHRIDIGTANLVAYEAIDKILARYFDFHQSHFDYAPTEERVVEFEELIVSDENVIQEFYNFEELSEEAQERAYADALHFLETEFGGSPSVMKKKEKIARQEANDGIYDQSGRFLELGIDYTV